MVGDSQIGKTSLMVKYVEGSFDEDYIQTLGKFGIGKIYDRGKLYGENNSNKKYRDNI